MPTSQGFRGLRVYQLAFKLAMEIYNESKKFPLEELYSLTDQIRRASRSVPGNIAEGIGGSGIRKSSSTRCQRQTGKAAKHKSGSISLLLVVTSQQNYKPDGGEVTKIGRMLGGMIAHPERFCS